MINIVEFLQKGKISNARINRPVYNYKFNRGDNMIFIGIYGDEIKPYINLLNQTKLPSESKYCRNFINRYKNSTYTHADGIVVYMCLFEDKSSNLGYNLDFESADRIELEINDGDTNWEIINKKFTCNLEDMLNYNLYENILGKNS